MVRSLLAAVLLSAVPLSPARAAEKFPAVVTAEAELGSDLEAARKEAKEAGLRRAVLDALRAEVGQSTLDDNALVVKARFVNPYADFIEASGVLGESRAGGRLKVTVGYELDRDKLRTRIATLKLQPPEPRARVALLWGEEERAVKAEDALGEGGAEALYRAAAWSDGVSAPADVNAVAAALAANGFDVPELSAADRAWAREELGGREVTKQFLRDAAGRLNAAAAVFVRIVHRRIAGPPAAHLRFSRAHHVAFVYDAAKGDLAGPPVAVPVVGIEGAQGAAPVPDEWVNRLLAQLVSEKPPGARLVVKGLGSAGKFDAAWAALRKIEALGTVVPRHITAAAVVFEFAYAVDDEARAELEKALPGTWGTDGSALTVTLPPEPAAKPAAKPGAKPGAKPKR
jgi:hypothetical protein